MTKMQILRKAESDGEGRFCESTYQVGTDDRSIRTHVLVSNQFNGTFKKSLCFQIISALTDVTNASFYK